MRRVRTKPQAFPSRPGIPPLLYAALPLWGTCALSLTCLEEAEREAMLGCGFAGLVASLACVLFLAFYGTRRLLLAVLGVSLGLASAGQASLVLLADIQAAQESQGRPCFFRIVEDVQDSSYGRRAMARVWDEAGASFRVRVSLPEGCTARMWDSFVSPCRIRSPGQSARSYYWRRACVGSMSPNHVEVLPPEGMLGALSELRALGLGAYAGYAREGPMLLKSVSFGDRSDLFASEFYGTVKRAGLAHLVAVSGAHMSIVAAASAALMRRLHMPKPAIVCAQTALCLAYVVLAGAPVSAIRAASMAVCALFSFFGKRRSYSLNGLALCIAGFVVLDPFASTSVSFALSALACLGISLFSAYFSFCFSVLFRGHAYTMCSLLGLTCAALMATTPLSVSLFGQISFVSLLSNVLAAPFFALLCVGGMVFGLLGGAFPVLSWSVALMCCLSQAFCDLVSLLARIPFAATSFALPGWLLALVAGGAAFLLLRFWPSPTGEGMLRACAAGLSCVLVLLFVLPLAHGAEIIMLDVGQGDAFVLRSAQHAILVDTGNQDTAVLKGLARHDVRHLDAVLITHPDDDHCAALPAILDFIEVDRVLVAQDLLDCPCSHCSSLRQSAAGAELAGLSVGQSLAWGVFSAHVLAPESFTEEGGNADSVVLHVEADLNQDGIREASALFTGDAESEVLESLMRRNALPHADIYKVGHHGSEDAVTADQLAVMEPRMALISVGAHNRYGHPHPDTLALLEKGGVSVFCTDELGDVVCTIHAGSIEVHPA